MIPIPVVNKDVYARSKGGVDFSGDDNRVGLVFVSPERNFGLFVPRLLGDSLVDVLPFAATVVEDSQLLPAGFGLVCRPNVRCDVVPRRIGGKRGKNRAYCRREFQHFHIHSFSD